MSNKDQEEIFFIFNFVAYASANARYIVYV